MSGNAMNQFSERVDILDVLAPTAANAAIGAHTTSCVSMTNYHRAFVLIILGEAAQGATIDIAIQQATDTSCSGAKAMTAKAPDQLVAGDSGGYVGIELQSEELDVDNGFHTFKVISTVGSGTYYHAVFIFGLDGRYEPMDVTDFVELVE